MTSNTDTLRNLAKAVIETPQLGNMASRQQQSDHFTRLSANLMAWQSAANPATFLALLDTIDAQRKLLEQARDAQQAIVNHQCLRRWVPEQPDDGWRPKSQVLFDSIDAIAEHLK